MIVYMDLKKEVCQNQVLQLVTNPYHVGHVSVVEEINGTQIKTSNSGWGGPFFWVATVDESDGYCESWMTQGGRDYYCQGFIYLDTYVPPTPPSPCVTDSSRKYGLTRGIVAP